MRFSEPEHDDTQIELTPLIDVVFLLLIFFMVSTTFSRESSIQIDLPEATERVEQQDEPLRVEILVSKDSSYAIRAPGEEAARALLNDERVTLLRAVAEYSDLDILMVIRADRLAPHEAVMQVMDVARSLGISRLSFSAQLTTEDEGDGEQRP